MTSPNEYTLVEKPILDALQGLIAEPTEAVGRMVGFLEELGYVE